MIKQITLLVILIICVKSSDAQKISYTSRVNDNQSVSISLIGDSSRLIYFKNYQNATASDRFYLYNLTEVAPISGSKVLAFDFSNLEGYWFLPFEDSNVINLREFVYYECCGGCSASHECHWYPAGNNCWQCDCSLNHSTVGCVVTKYQSNKYSIGSGIIVFAKSIEAY
jgi:hypothetical protein